MGAEGPAPEFEVGGGIVHHRSLVDVYIQSVVRLELKGCLHAGRAECLLGGIAHLHLLCRTADFAHTRDVVAVFLGVVVPGYPESGVVAGHGELGKFVLDHEIDQLRLLGEFITEAQSVVVEAEADYHRYAILLERDGHLIVVVADVGFLPPDCLPGLVETGCLHVLQGKAALHVHRLAIAFAAVFRSLADVYLFSPESETESAWFHHFPALVSQFIGWFTFLVQAKIQPELFVGAEQSASRHQQEE